MASTLKILANGQLTSTTTDLYTTPSVTSTIIKLISMVNTNSTAEEINLYILPTGGTARRIVPKNLSLGAGYKASLSDELFFLSAGDKVRGETTTNSKVDYIICGIEKV